ncbi:MDR family MFS transporter [Nocardioides bruguierae]|uniref:Multidrug efflux MFS transporter n=1 Tax=Nocardioides bruguierae TaxID=2945102 RepID=A0A9X2IHA4_9ACTN|nr:MDR family MFS transporter [Nocardioides bruguierae]MCM0622404.1 multidrug efflux MFS transporter [Nocardioides bruguierae]
MTAPTDTPASTATTEDAATSTSGTGRLVALLVCSAFVVILNETIMSVALPDLMREFAIGASSAQWITTAFMLTMAVVIPISGYLLTRLPLRTVFIVAMTAFSVGTAVSAVAPVFGVLVLGRVIQASGTAVMMPLLITTVMTIVEPERRGRMMGTISIVISVAPAIGPTISGIILQSLSWRWMFLFVLPIALVALAAGARWVRNVTEPRAIPLDVLSVVLSAIGFAGLVYGLAGFGEAAEGDPLVPLWVPLTVGGVSLALFVARQLVLKDRALLDLRAFASPSFSLAIGLMAVVFAALFGVIVLLPLYLQNALELSVLQTGLMLLPGGLCLGLLAPFVGRAFDRWGPRPLVPPGIGLAAVALWLMTTLDVDSSRLVVVAMHVVMSIGLALAFTPLMTTALASVPPRLYSHGSAILGTLQQVAGAAGTALFVTLLTRQEVTSLAAGAPETVATADGLHAALLVASVVATVAFALSFAIRRAPEHATEPGEHAVPAH